MKIVVIARTLNEERNVNRFAYAYRWADQILIADGGSTDETKSIASEFENVSIKDFTEKMDLGNGIIANPRGKHINFLIDWAKEEDADWIIFDDFDCVPTRDLQNDARGLFDMDYELIHAYRMFILGKDKWFPKMSEAGQGLWAWRSEVDVRADESSYTISMQIPKGKTLYLKYPFSLLHYFYPDEETLQRKKKQYLRTGEVDESYSPKSQFGRLEDLPEWAGW